jgi:hypothetical protein
MQILKHRRAQDGSYRLLVWLDESKTVEGAPDPAYVRKFDWAPKPSGVTAADYVAMQKRETKLRSPHNRAGRGQRSAPTGSRSDRERLTRR